MASEQDENSEEAAVSPPEKRVTPAHKEPLGEAVVPDYSKALREAVMPNLAAMREAVVPDYSKALREAVMPNLAAMREAVVPDYSKALREAVMPNLAAMREAVVPDNSKALREAVMPNLAAMREAAAVPHFSHHLREAVLAPGIATQILSLVRTPQAQPSPAGFEAASRELLGSLGIDEESELSDLAVRPTTDDTAFRAIAQASPDMAAAISRAADTAGNPLLPPHVIRNMLAWLVMSLIVVAFVGGTVLFPPWGPVAVALLSATGVTAPAAYKRISAPQADEK